MSESERKKGDGKCDYVPLTPGEINKLKNNGHHPHDLKPRGSKDDLVKCKPSSKVGVKRKTKYQDPKTGKWVFPKDNEVEDTGIVLDDLPWHAQMSAETIIEFKVTGFAGKASQIVRDLKITPSRVWSAGDLRSPNTLLVHSENGFAIRAAYEESDFETRVTRLFKRIIPKVKELKQLGAMYQVACVFYIHGNLRPVIHFSAEVIEAMATLDASLDVDLYYLGDADVGE